MKNINKTNIIILALLYNYISNKEKELKIEDIERFFNELNFELFLNFYKTTKETEDKFQKVYQYNKNKDYIGFSDIYTTPQLLKYIKRKYIDILPKEVIEASLSPNVLVTINATKVCLEPNFDLKDYDLENNEYQKIKSND